MIGEKISPILSEIESALFEFEVQELGNPKYTEDGFRAAVKIFMSAVMDKMWELQKAENMDMDTRYEMATKCGSDIRRIVKIYTGIDTHKIYTKSAILK